MTCHLKSSERTRNERDGEKGREREREGEKGRERERGRVRRAPSSIYHLYIIYISSKYHPYILIIIIIIHLICNALFIQKNLGVPTY